MHDNVGDRRAMISLTRLRERSKQITFGGVVMVGIGNRSGGHNKKTEAVAHGSGSPESPRKLSDRAEYFFRWLVDRLGASEDGAGWSRADGSLLASTAELLESEEILGELIKQAPDDLRLHRMRGQFADRIVRVSNLIGFCPKDRATIPATVAKSDEEDPGIALLKRMGVRTDFGSAN